MNFVTRAQISRRMLLRGAGTAIALPLLDAMFPALTAAPASVRRLSVVYVPNGIIMQDWTPPAAGSGFGFTRILKPLEPFRNDMTIVSGLASKSSLAGPGGGDHA